MNRSIFPRPLRLPRPILLLAGLALLGCINIHIYFPEAELREAAAEIVDEVRPDVASAPAGPEGEGKEAPQEAPAAPPAGGVEKKTSGSLVPFLRFSAAHAEERIPGNDEEKKDAKKIQLDVTSPVIKKIKETLKARYTKLIPFYEKGAVGEGADGYLAQRETEKLSLKEKRDVQALLDAENLDRKNLYGEIARANGIDASLVPDVGRLFSEEWQKKSKPGWWVEREKGKWEKKEKESKGKDKR